MAKDTGFRGKGEGSPFAGKAKAAYFVLSLKPGLPTVLSSHPALLLLHGGQQGCLERLGVQVNSLPGCLVVSLVEGGMGQAAGRGAHKCFWRHWGAVCPSVPGVSGGNVRTVERQSTRFRTFPRCLEGGPRLQESHL